MADLVKNDPSVDGISAMRCQILTGLLAGETLVKGDIVYVKSDGKIWRSVSTVVDTTTIETGGTDYVANLTRVNGVVNDSYVAGEPCTVFCGGIIINKYGSSLTIGAPYYVSSTVGQLEVSAIAVGDSPVAKSISATDIILVRG